MRRLLAAVLALAVLPAWAAGEPGVLAVLSSGLGAYEQGLRGFESGFGAKVTAVKAADLDDLPEGTKVVAAFGARAAARSYPSGVFVISCLAPGLPPAPGSGARVPMVARPRTLLAGIRGVQPAARSLAVLWSNPAFADYVRELKARAQEAGLTVRSVEVETEDDLPAALRALRGRVDAVWLAPDPDLINARSFALLAEFARATRLPLYAPTLELVKEGATAAVAVSYFEAGRVAGLAARRALAGEKLPADIYVEKLDVAVNGGRAAREGLVVSTGAASVHFDPESSR